MNDRVHVTGAKAAFPACSATKVISPALVAVTVPFVMNAGPLCTRKLTGKPLPAVAVNGWARPQTSASLVVGEVQAMVWMDRVTSIVALRETAWNWALPACSARTTTEPAPVKVNRFPATEAGPDSTLKVTGRPDDAVALSVSGDWDRLTEAGGAKPRV